MFPYQTQAAGCPPEISLKSVNGLLPYDLYVEKLPSILTDRISHLHFAFSKIVLVYVNGDGDMSGIIAKIALLYISSTRVFKLGINDAIAAVRIWRP